MTDRLDVKRTIATAASDTGSRLRELRAGCTGPTGRPLTQTDLAGLTGIQQSEACRIETGKRLPTHEQIVKLAYAYGVDPNSLVIYPQP